jgi:hypothetical protein
MIMKLKTATLLASIGTAFLLAGNIILVLRNLTVAGHVPGVYLLSFGLGTIFHIGLLIFFITLYRNQ